MTTKRIYELQVGDIFIMSNIEYIVIAVTIVYISFVTFNCHYKKIASKSQAKVEVAGHIKARSNKKYINSGTWR